MREIINFNKDWLFHLGGDLPLEVMAWGNQTFFAGETRIWQKAGNHGVSKPGNPHVDEWRKIRVPHDYVLEGDFTKEVTPNNGALEHGEAWYAKKFTLPESDRGRRIILEFDGVYRDCTLYVNGNFVGRHMSGYTSFHYDISDFCWFGKENALALHVDARENELWSYEGGGIYRNVRMVKTGDVAVPPWGTYVTTGGEENPGLVKAEITLESFRYDRVSARIVNRVLDGSGREAARDEADLAVDDLERAVLTREFSVDNPTLWNIANPAMYTLETTVSVDGKETDRYETAFGFRYFKHTADTGFHLNGEWLKIKGVCVHQDHGCVGVAVPPAIQEWRIKQLKELGCNAIRTSHNPPDPILLDYCDKHGIMVMDEHRLSGTSPELLKQLEDLIIRDRNHPSVVWWSVGNEEMGIQDNELGEMIFPRMTRLTKKLDPSRLTTYAMNCDWQNIVDRYGDDKERRFDVLGTNYRGGGNNPVNFDIVHDKFSDWPRVSTESWGGTATRDLYEPDDTPETIKFMDKYGVNDGIWKDDEHRGFASDYDLCHTPWGCSIEEMWQTTMARPSLAGTFIWTGFDYRGETFPYVWPGVVTRFGLIDLCGFYKGAAHYIRTWWRPEEPHIHLMPHWDWHGHEGKEKRVRCYANTAKVELFLNGKSLGVKDMPEIDRLEWSVPWEPGVLEARGLDKAGNFVIGTKRVTPKAPAQVLLDSDRTDIVADSEDVIVINARIEDGDGNFCPRSKNQVEFVIDGPVEIIGVGNGNPVSHEPDLNTSRRKAFHGLCQVMLRSTGQKGKVTVKAVSAQLNGGRLSFSCS